MVWTSLTCSKLVQNWEHLAQGYCCILAVIHSDMFTWLLFEPQRDLHKLHSLSSASLSVVQLTPLWCSAHRAVK